MKRQRKKCFIEHLLTAGDWDTKILSASWFSHMQRDQVTGNPGTLKRGAQSCKETPPHPTQPLSQPPSARRQNEEGQKGTLDSELPHGRPGSLSLPESWPFDWGEVGQTSQESLEGQSRGHTALPAAQGQGPAASTARRRSCSLPRKDFSGSSINCPKAAEVSI